MSKAIQLFLMILSFSQAAHGDWRALVYDADKAPIDNPLKGFVVYSGEYSFPHSMEFEYVGLDDLMVGPSTFTFDQGLESLLNDIASRGNQAVIRVFLDYPSFRSALPQFLLDAGLTTTRYFANGGGYSPDYANELLVTALESFIAAFGARYDGDPRLGFIQLGLLGFWGEWHTYPREELFAPVETQNRVLTAFDNAFSKTHLVVSQDLLGYDPMASIGSKNIGFHDDDFANNTLPPGDNTFWSRMLANGFDLIWKTLPIGGEIQPDYQDVIWDDPSGAPEDYADSIATIHASWLLNYAAFDNDWTQSEIDRAMVGAKALGYELFVAEVDLPQTKAHGALPISVRLNNRGIAPFYYDWPVELGILSAENAVVKTFVTNWRLTTVIPEALPTSFIHTCDLSGVASGSYSVGLRVPNPLATGKPLKFANAEQGDVWLALGEIAISTHIPPNTDIDHSGTTDAVDVQLVINAALGITSWDADLDGNGEVDAVDVQLVINGALGIVR